MNRNENFHISNLIKIKFPISIERNLSFVLKKKKMIDAIHAIIVDK